MKKNIGIFLLKTESQEIVRCKKYFHSHNTTEYIFNEKLWAETNVEFHQFYDIFTICDALKIESLHLLRRVSL